MKKRNSRTRILRLILVILSILTTCCGFAFIILKTMVNGIPLTSDAWLSFWGSIIGSIVTILGIVLTLTYENKQNNNLRRLEAQPIIILKELTLGTNGIENEGTYRFSKYGDNDGDNLHFELPDIEIRNIGLNFATNIWLEFDFKINYGGRNISILDAKESKKVSISFDLTKDSLQSIFENHTYEYKKDKIFNACIARTFAFLAQSNRKGSQEHIERVSSVKGNIITTFEDIYGNTYQQRRTAELNFVELSNEPSFLYMCFPEFAEATLIERKI